MELVLDYKNVERALAARLTNSLAYRPFAVRLIASSPKDVIRDIVVYDLDENPVAVFEVKGFPQAWALRKQIDFLRTFKGPDVRFYIITDGDDFFIYSKISKEFVKKDYEDVLECITTGLPALGNVPTAEEICKAIMKVATKVNIKQYNSIKKYIEKTRTKRLFKTDRATGKIEFSSPSSEDAFFSCLLNGRIPSKLCRFTTRHNLFLLFTEKKQNMCSIVCMNDKSEESYADKMTGLGEGEKGSMILENNNCFILSLMSQDKSDDLTLWRLYGDDAKGVCVNYEIREKQRKRKFGNFYMSCICYGESERTHRELDFLREVFQININHWRFQFNRWYIWKHFFKSFRFKDENEVRLLYLSDGKMKEDKKWIENSDSGIVSKMLLFPMVDTENKFPLMLTNVIVGPKSPEPGKIAEQFSFLVSQEWRDYSHPILIRQSDIKEYR